MKRPQRWNASSSERDTSSLASSSELMSSMQVISWDKRWRRSTLVLEPWDAELLMLSERTRGLSVKGSIFGTWCWLCYLYVRKVRKIIYSNRKLRCRPSGANKRNPVEKIPLVCFLSDFFSWFGCIHLMWPTLLRPLEVTWTDALLVKSLFRQLVI